MNRFWSIIYLYLEGEEMDLYLFKKALVQSEMQMQTASSKIWTLISESISYDNSHYTNLTS